MKVSRNIAITLVCIILGVMLAWQYKSINYNQTVTSFQNKRAEELKDELIKLQNTNNELRARLQELNEEVRAYENAKSGSDEVTYNLKKQLEEAKVFSGLTDVKGRGVIVTLNKNEFIDVKDIDILNMVNELRAAGAQAISVNDERITAVSEVRQVGGHVVVNGINLEAPFVIKAISDPDKLERALKMIGGVIENLESYQLKVNLKKSDDIMIPKVRDDGTVIKTDLLTPVK